jgi:hypothetical protein
MLRVMCKALVEWDGVRASSAWVRAQIPLSVRACLAELRALEEARSGSAGGQSLADMIMALAGDSSDDEDETQDDEGQDDGAATACAKPAPSTGAKAAPGDTVSASEARPALALGIRLQDADLGLCREMLTRCLEGAAFAIGLRYAGTGSLQARDQLLRLVRFFSEMRCGSGDSLTALRRSLQQVGEAETAGSEETVSRPREAVGSEQSVSRPRDAWGEGGSPSLAVLMRLRPSSRAMESARATCAVALGMVMAGTGDAPSLRMLRACRRSLSWDTQFGFHMGIGAAIGLLMLSGGRASLRRDPAAIACLVTGLLPLWPHGSTANKDHVQPLRVLWAGALERRCLEVLSSHTGRAAPGTVEMEWEETDDEGDDCPTGQARPVRPRRVRRRVMRPPVLLPELSSLRRIRVLEAHPAAAAAAATAAATTGRRRAGGADDGRASGGICHCSLELFPSRRAAHALALVGADRELDEAEAASGTSADGARAAAIHSSRLQQEAVEAAEACVAAGIVHGPSPAAVDAAVARVLLRR